MEELTKYIPVLVGLAAAIVVTWVLASGIGWLFHHPELIVLAAGMIGWLIWRGAHRNRV